MLDRSTDENLIMSGKVWTLRIDTGTLNNYIWNNLIQLNKEHSGQ